MGRTWYWTEASDETKSHCFPRCVTVRREEVANPDDGVGTFLYDCELGFYTSTGKMTTSTSGKCRTKVSQSSVKSLSGTGKFTRQFKLRNIIFPRVNLFHWHLHNKKPKERLRVILLSDAGKRWSQFSQPRTHSSGQEGFAWAQNRPCLSSRSSQEHFDSSDQAQYL